MNLFSFQVSYNSLILSGSMIRIIRVRFLFYFHYLHCKLCILKLSRGLFDSNKFIMWYHELQLLLLLLLYLFFYPKTSRIKRFLSEKKKPNFSTFFFFKCSNRRDIQFGTLKKIHILRSSYTQGRLMREVLGYF